ELAGFDGQGDVIDRWVGQSVVFGYPLEVDACALLCGDGRRRRFLGARDGHAVLLGRRFLLRNNWGSSSTRVTATTTRLDAAAIVGSISTVTLLYICTGIVWKVGERRKSAITTSSNEVTN